MLSVLAAALLQEPGLWDGFEAGSWIRLSYRSLRSEDAKPWGESRVERSSDGLLESWQNQTPHAAALPERPRLTDGLRETARRREALAVQDRTLACEVVEYQPAEPIPGRTLTLTLWRAAVVALPPRELPCRKALRRVPTDVVALTLVDETATLSLAVTRRVVGLDVPLEVAGRRLSCVAEQGSSSTLNGGSYARRDFTRWLSAEVPGILVHQDRDCTGDPKRPQHTYTTRDELVDFHVVR